MARRDMYFLSHVTVAIPSMRGKMAARVKPAMRKIRVLLADDHEAVLTRIRMILGEEFDVVGSVSNGQEALLEAKRLHPDVLVLDISMPVLNGIQTAKEIRASHSPIKIVFLTVHKDPDFVAAAFSAGASAYVVKSDVTIDLVPAIRQAAEGISFISHSIS